MSEKPIENKKDKDIEELKAVFQAITDFINNLREPIKEFIQYMMQQLDGKRIGEEVGEFYNQLVMKGVPKELAAKMTEDYFRRRMELTVSIKDFLSMTKSFPGIKPGKHEYSLKSSTPEKEEEKQKENEREYE